MIVGDQGPAVVLSARACAWLERYARLSSLRVLVRGVDPHIAQQLEEIRRVGAAWRGSAGGTTVAPRPEPAAPSEWLSTGQVGDLLRIGPRAVVKAIARGQITATKVGPSWRISREAAEHYRSSRTERTRQ